jgi:hypothetical protein
MDPGFFPVSIANLLAHEKSGFVAASVRCYPIIAGPDSSRK